MEYLCINQSNEEPSQYTDMLSNNIEEDWNHDEDQSDVENIMSDGQNAFFNMQVSITMIMICIKIFHVYSLSFLMYRIYSGTGI